MDDERDDSGDDDVTIVGDHELVAELRRIAADADTRAPGRPLPPPAPSRARRRNVTAGRCGQRRAGRSPPAPRPPRAPDDEWWDDADGDAPRSCGW